MSAIAIPLSVILIIVMVVLLVIYSGRKPKIFVEKEGIFIKDLMYPSRIFAETIKSVSLCDKMPKVISRSNGYAGAMTWKGFFRIYKDGKCSALLYLEKYRKGPFIQIETTKRLYFINLANEEQTRQLYEEIKSTVKFVDEKNLLVINDTSPFKSIIIVAAFIVIVTVVSLLPVFGMKG